MINASRNALYLSLLFLEGAIMPLNRLVIYAANVQEAARFYETHFGYKAMSLPGDSVIHSQARIRRRGCRGLLQAKRGERPEVRHDTQG